MIEPLHTEPITIVTERRMQDPQFAAWEKGGPKSLKSTCTGSEEGAVRNFACKVFFGHTRYEYFSALVISQMGPNLWRASLKSAKAENTGAALRRNEVAGLMKKHGFLKS